MIIVHWQSQWHHNSRDNASCVARPIVLSVPSSAVLPVLHMPICSSNSKSPASRTLHWFLILLPLTLLLLTGLADLQAYDLLYNSLQNTAKKFRPGLSYMFGLGTWKEFSNHTTGPRDQGLKMGVSLEGVHDQVCTARLGLAGQPHTPVAVLSGWSRFGTFAIVSYRSGSNEPQGLAYDCLHIQVHVNIGGGGGHMMYTEVAGFDPIFFLHHANVDRLLALWQVWSCS